MGIGQGVLMLFDMTDGNLIEVPKTTFAAEKVLERSHLQAALREHIEVLGDDLLVVAEEFGDFKDARRRIDLLCVDHEARLVVVELKRTDDGGHMELQALRYAAMVSTMTFDQLVETYQRHLKAVAPDEIGSAREALADWLDDVGRDDAVVSRDVRILLAAADFGREITTTVLWLNDVYGTDIRCVRLSPYRIEGRLLLDVQPVIPLPEAEELTIQLRRRETAARVATSGRDRTPYVITSPAGRTAALPKRRAILAMIHALNSVGVSAESIQAVITGPRFLAVDGVLDEEELADRFVERYPNAEKHLGRWFLDEPLHDSDQTWVLSKMWGTDTGDTLERLVALAPISGFAFAPA